MLFAMRTFIFIASCLVYSSTAFRLSGSLSAFRTTSRHSSRLFSTPSECFRTCKQCKKQFIPSKNNSGKDCVFHPGIYSGRLNRINDVDTSDLEFFWSCCGEYSLSAEGCMKTKHYTVSFPGNSA